MPLVVRLRSKPVSTIDVISVSSKLPTGTSTKSSGPGPVETRCISGLVLNGPKNPCLVADLVSAQP